MHDTLNGFIYSVDNNGLEVYGSDVSVNMDPLYEILIIYYIIQTCVDVYIIIGETIASDISQTTTQQMFVYMGGLGRVRGVRTTTVMYRSTAIIAINKIDWTKFIIFMDSFA